MKPLLFKQCVLAAACFLLAPVYAQQTTDNATARSENMRYALGNLYEITVDMKNTGLDISLDIYTSEEATNLAIKTKKFKGESLSFELRESDGTLLQSNTIDMPETILNTAPLKPAAYTLKVFSKDKTVQAFTIVKN